MLRDQDLTLSKAIEICPLSYAASVNTRLLNPAKLNYLLTDLPWIGHVIFNGVLKPDPEKIYAIVDYPVPSSKAALQRFLDRVNYLAKFCPNHSTIAKPLRDLLRDENLWVWDAV